MKYDDASWHFESTPEGPDEARWAIASAHIGVYLKWCILKGWAGEIHTEDEFSTKAIESLRSGKITGAEFFINQCDYKFTDEDLNDEGNKFTAYYFEGRYPQDLESVARNAVLTAPESEYDFAAISRLIDRQCDEWVALGRPDSASKSKKPWWKLW